MQELNLTVGDIAEIIGALIGFIGFLITIFKVMLHFSIKRVKFDIMNEVNDKVDNTNSSLSEQVREIAEENRDFRTQLERKNTEAAQTYVTYDHCRNRSKELTDWFKREMDKSNNDISQLQDAKKDKNGNSKNSQ